MGDNPKGDDHHNSQTDSVQPQMTIHPVTYPAGMPMHMYPFPPGIMPTQPPRTKRRQVKNACTNCQKACKKCDDARPCLRCVKYGISEECVDSQRKERQKGIKRGPYKKRDGKNRASNNVEQQVDIGMQSGMMIPPAVAATSATPPIPYVTPYPPFYGQYPATHVPKAGEGPVYIPQLFYAPIPAAQPMPTGHGNGQDGDAPGYPPAPYYPVFTAPYPQYATPYMVQASRPEGQMPMAPTSHHAHHYTAYPQAYTKPPSRGPDVGNQLMDSRRDIRLEGGRLGDGLHGSHSKSG